MTKETYALLKQARIDAEAEPKVISQPRTNRASRRRFGRTKTAGHGRRRRSILALSNNIVRAELGRHVDLAWHNAKLSARRNHDHPRTKARPIRLEDTPVWLQDLLRPGAMAVTKPSDLRRA